MEFSFITYKFDKKIRLGSKIDGGYVISELDGGYDCYISCGVNNEESFTRDFIDFYKIPDGKMFAFDGTIDIYPYEYSTDIFFMKKNISSINTSSTTNLDFLLNNHKDIFLKMDIEGHEYGWLNSDDVDIKNIKQLVVEFHGVLDESWGYKTYQKNLAMKKILKTHTLVHCHGNNFGAYYPANYYGDYMPSVIECTFVRNSEIKERQLNTTKFPIEGLDFTNINGGSDCKLESWPFVEFSKKVKSKIPKKIFQTYYCNFDDLDEDIKYSIYNLKKLNPEYQYQYYTDLDCEVWVKENCNKDIYDLYKRIKIPVAKADFFRYLLIYKEGGIYLDIKSSMVYPIDYILQLGSETILSHWLSREHSKELDYDLGEFQNWFLIYEPNHPILKETIDRVVENLKKYKYDINKDIKSQIIETTGPIPYSESVLNYLNKNGRENIIEHKASGRDGWPSGLMYSIYNIWGGDHQDVIKSYDKNIPII